MPILNRDGVDLYYEVHGQGPTILLTHGYSATSRMWEPNIAALSANHQLVTWDMRGHGRTAYPADPAAYTEANTTADMAALLDHVGAEKAVIGGLSLGGYMSMAFYKSYPERVRALLIIDTGPGFRNDQARADWNVIAMNAAKRYDKGLDQRPEDGAEVVLSNHRSSDGLAGAARGMLTQHDPSVIDTLPRIKVPALVIVGDQDLPFLNATDYMAAKIPGAAKLVIPNARHAANIDQPEIFNEGVLGFLAEVE